MFNYNQYLFNVILENIEYHNYFNQYCKNDYVYLHNLTIEINILDNHLYIDFYNFCKYDFFLEYDQNDFYVFTQKFNSKIDIACISFVEFLKKEKYDNNDLKELILE